MILDFMKRFFSIVCIGAIAVSAIAVPARREGVVRTAADGTEKIVYIHGDEFFHYATDGEGNWLDDETLMPLSAEQKAARLEAGKVRAQVRKAVQERRATGVDRLLSPRGPVILVNYPDQAFSSTNEEMTQWAMSDHYTYNGATGSIHQYFYDQSWGQYDLQIDVYGPVTVSKELAYYGKDAGGREGSDQHPDELIVEACQLAHDSLGADFSQYDSNNDGYVDWVVILYAGKGQADGGVANTIWPHQYDLSYTGKDFQLDGKTVDHYCCLNEIDGQTNKRCGIGTFCHEFSHVMGLPDLYSTDQYATHKTMGEWDILDYGPYNNGGNTPPAYSAYERWFMGWIEPTLLNSASSVVLGNLSDAGSACYITANGNAISNIISPSPNVFYMLENRQQSGWDYYIPGHGMLITKVNFKYNWWYGNSVNYSASNMGVDIIEADGQAPSYVRTNRNNGYFGKQGDAYPAGSDSFTTVANYQVTEITEENGLISFKVNGGGEEINLDIWNSEAAKGEWTKVLRNGQILIQCGDRIYDLLGRMITAL